MAKKTKSKTQPQQTLLDDEISAEDLALLSSAFSTIAQVFTFLSLLKVREEAQNIESSQGNQLEGLEINLPPFRRRT